MEIIFLYPVPAAVLHFILFRLVNLLGSSTVDYPTLKLFLFVLWILLTFTYSKQPFLWLVGNLWNTARTSKRLGKIYQFFRTFSQSVSIITNGSKWPSNELAVDWCLNPSHFINQRQNRQSLILRSLTMNHRKLVVENVNMLYSINSRRIRLEKVKMS